jgi:hypothetical protein
MKLRRSRVPPAPVPPENVRLVYPDGTEVPVDCRYDGVNTEGIHEWTSVSSHPAMPGMQLAIEMLPAKTQVGLALSTARRRS